MTCRSCVLPIAKYATKKGEVLDLSNICCVIYERSLISAGLMCDVSFVFTVIRLSIYPYNGGIQSTIG